MTETSIKAVFVKISTPITVFLLLKHILCIYYLLEFKKDQAKILALINFGIEVNVITLAYTTNLGLKAWPINIGIQKIDGFTIQMFKMVLASF